MSRELRVLRAIHCALRLARQHLELAHCREPILAGSDQRADLDTRDLLRRRGRIEPDGDLLSAGRAGRGPLCPLGVVDQVRQIDSIARGSGSTGLRSEVSAHVDRQVTNLAGPEIRGETGEAETVAARHEPVRARDDLERVGERRRRVRVGDGRRPRLVVADEQLHRMSVGIADRLEGDGRVVREIGPEARTGSVSPPPFELAFVPNPLDANTFQSRSSFAPPKRIWSAAISASRAFSMLTLPLAIRSQRVVDELDPAPVARTLVDRRQPVRAAQLKLGRACSVAVDKGLADLPVDGVPDLAVRVHLGPRRVVADVRVVERVAVERVVTDAGLDDRR